MSEDRLGLHNLPRPDGATKNAKRKGRGPGSGLGKTAGRGHKGQRSRSGGGVRPGFEGGQMPLIRRVPKRGFHNPFRTTNQVVHTGELEKVTGDVVSPITLAEAGLVSSATERVKILAKGEPARALAVRGCAASKSARSLIEKAGGSVEA